MSIVGGFDVHRRQITFDYVDTDTGQVVRGRIAPACRPVLRRWLTQRFAGRTDVAFAVEACTGWRFIVEELERAGMGAGGGRSAAGLQAVLLGLGVLDGLDPELGVLHRQIRAFANRQPGCKTLQIQYGVGPITAAAIWAMMGDTRRFSASRQAVR